MASSAAPPDSKRQDRRLVAGIQLVIEYRKGDTRTGKSPNGNVWSRKMKSAYGRIVNTKGLDGDPLDVYLGPNPDSPTVYTIDQMKGPEYKELDEQKHMLGYNSLEEAKKAYLENYPDDRILGKIKAVPMPRFKSYVAQCKSQDPVKLARWCNAYSRNAVAEGSPMRKLSTIDELNLARIASGRSLIKISEKSEGPSIVGQLAGIPVGTGAGILASRIAEKSGVGPLPLAPFVGMTAGPIIGGEVGKKVKETLRAKQAGLLFKAVRGVGKAVDSGLRAAGPLNIAKGGVLAAGTGTLYGGYKGVGAAKRLALRPQHGFSLPKQRTLGRAF